MSTLRRFLTALLSLSFILSSCGSPSTPAPDSMTPADSQPTRVPIKPAFETGVYPNLFKDYLGKSDEEIQAKIDSTFQQLFYGKDSSERVYYPVGADMAYILDEGHNDVRSEGMSYGMMIAVQLNKKEEFDRIWKWTKTYMYQKNGGYKGYFAWHCKTDGTQLALNPASDGEEWFIMALMFANARWGSGEGIYNYSAEAQAILDVALHADKRGDLATDLFDPITKQVVFVPQPGQNSQFTDPSYHLPHYYELWVLWADKDNDFWAEAAQVSRAYLPKAVHPQTGLAPNYSYFDGTPYSDDYNGAFRHDAFRVGANVGVDYVWFAPSQWHVEQSNRLLKFFASQGMDKYPNQYTIDGKPLTAERSPGLIATNAVAALAADRAIGEPFVQALWDLDVPTGKWRYYDGLLMMLGLLQVSGNFRIYEPGTAPEPSGQVFPTPKPEVAGKFAPQSGHALLIVGNNVESVNSYFDTTVTAPGGVALNLSLDLHDIESLNTLASTYPKSVLSIGVDVNDVAAEKIDALLDALTAHNRPVLFRLAYNPADAPDAYISAWIKFHKRNQASGSTNVALVWESTSCEESNLADFYPGDDVVDWIGVKYECANSTIEFTRAHLKPVILTASSQGADWNTWFAPFFKFINDNNDVIRAATYINDVPMSAEILKQWKAETRQSFWLRANPKLFGELGFVK